MFCDGSIIKSSESCCRIGNWQSLVSSSSSNACARQENVVDDAASETSELVLDDEDGSHNLFALCPLGGCEAELNDIEKMSFRQLHTDLLCVVCKYDPPTRNLATEPLVLQMSSGSLNVAEHWVLGFRTRKSPIDMIFFKLENISGSKEASPCPPFDLRIVRERSLGHVQGSRDHVKHKYVWLNESALCVQLVRQASDWELAALSVGPVHQLDIFSISGQTVFSREHLQEFADQERERRRALHMARMALRSQDNGRGRGRARGRGRGRGRPRGRGRGHEWGQGSRLGRGRGKGRGRQGRQQGQPGSRLPEADDESEGSAAKLEDSFLHERDEEDASDITETAETEAAPASGAAANVEAKPRDPLDDPDWADYSPSLSSVLGDLDDDEERETARGSSDHVTHVPTADADSGLGPRHPHVPTEADLGSQPRARRVGADSRAHVSRAIPWGVFQLAPIVPKTGVTRGWEVICGRHRNKGEGNTSVCKKNINLNADEGIDDAEAVLRLKRWLVAGLQGEDRLSVNLQRSDHVKLGGRRLQDFAEGLSEQQCDDVVSRYSQLGLNYESTTSDDFG